MSQYDNDKDKQLADMLKDSMLEPNSNDFSDKVMRRIIISETRRSRTRYYLFAAWAFLIPVLIFLPGNLLRLPSLIADFIGKVASYFNLQFSFNVNDSSLRFIFILFVSILILLFIDHLIKLTFRNFQRN